MAVAGAGEGGAGGAPPSAGCSQVWKPRSAPGQAGPEQVGPVCRRGGEGQWVPGPGEEEG